MKIIRGVQNIIREVQNIIREIQNRWGEEINEFWKKILNFTIIIGTSAAGVISADVLWNLQGYGVHPLIFTISGYILTACGALGLAAKLTKK